LYIIIKLNLKILGISLMVLSIGMMVNAYAHTMEVVGDYKIEAGWETEPPLVGHDNAITLEVGIASEHDKAEAEAEDAAMEEGGMENMTHNDEMAHDEHADEMAHDEHADEEDMNAPPVAAGLLNNFKVDVTIGDTTTPLKLVEDPKFNGIYHADFTPSVAGFPMVHVVGMLAGEDVDITFHIEEVEAMSALSPIKQVHEGISPENVECKTGLVLVLRVSDSSPACVKPASADKLVELGWGTKA
jgi:hypothetical protein